MRGNFMVLTIRMVVGQICRNMVFPYASLLILAVGGNTSQIGIVNSLRPIAGLLVFPVAGYLTDRRGRVRLMVLAGYMSAFTTLIIVFAPSWEWIALASLLQGFAVLEFPPSSAILAESLEPRYRGVGFATMSTLATIFAITSPYIAGVITETLGNDVGVRALYAIYMLSFIINILILRYLTGAEPEGGPRRTPQRPRYTAGSVRRHPRARQEHAPGSQGPERRHRDGFHSQRVDGSLLGGLRH